MRGNALRRTAPLLQRPHSLPAATRAVHISASPVGEANEDLVPQASDVDLQAPDAQFEVLGSPYSLLSASLAASQTLYTRRGTLVGVAGKAENAVSSLTSLSPLARLPLGIPFLYQKVTSASPITCLISTRSPVTSFTTIHLDGTTDWMVARRNGLLAWTGQTLSLSASARIGLSLAQWGHTRVTGRGLVALVGSGQVYQVRVGAGEEYVAHPANVLAYSINRNPPSPYRFKSSVLRLEVPGLSWLSSWIPQTRFFTVMRESDTWRRVQRIYYTIRTWSRRTIWGDRLFLRFHGPTTLLLQTRAGRMADTFTAAEVNEVADVEPGSLAPKATLKGQTPEDRRAEAAALRPSHTEPSMSFVTVDRRSGQVSFEGQKDKTPEIREQRPDPPKVLGKAA